MTAIVGLDLAWTTYRPSGVCVLRADGGDVRLETLECRTGPPEEFRDLLCDLGPDVIAAVDAPLLRREGCVAERELARAFGAYHAAAYNANTAFLERHGLMAGPALGARLAEAGFSLDPFAVGKPGSRRTAFEMYPHAFHVTAFRISKRIAYKKGALALRREGFATYQQLLRALLEREAPQLLGEPAVERVLHPSALVGGGRALKATEDSLDALTCAIAALRAYRCGVAQADVFGDVETGYIAIPGLSEDDRFPRPAPAGP